MRTLTSMSSVETERVSYSIKSLPGFSAVLPGMLVLVAFLDLFSQLPVIAPYALSLGAGGEQAGLIVAMYSITNLCGNMLAGQMLDRWGRKLPLVLGLCGAGASLLLYAASQSPMQLLAVRALHGLLAGLITPSAFTILADLAPETGRARAMGIGGSFIGIAAIIGPATSGMLRNRWGFDSVFWTVSAIMFLTALAAVLFVPRLRGNLRPREASRAPFRARALLSPCLSVFSLMATLGILTTYLPPYLELRGYGNAASGLMFSLFSVAAVGVMVSPLGRVGSRVGAARALLWGLLAVGAGLLVLASTSGAVATGLSMVIYGCGFGLIFPASNTAVADASGPDRRGRAFAVLYAVFSLGVIAGSVTAGSMEGVGGEAPFYAGIAIALAGAASVRVLGKSTG